MPRHEVEEAIAVDVPHFGALAVRHDERIVARIGRRLDGDGTLEHGFGLRAGQRRADVRRFHDSTTVWDCSRRYCAR